MYSIYMKKSVTLGVITTKVTDSFHKISSERSELRLYNYKITKIYKI